MKRAGFHEPAQVDCLQVRRLVLHWLHTHNIDTTNLPLRFDANAAEASRVAFIPHGVFRKGRLAL